MLRNYLFIFCFILFSLFGLVTQTSAEEPSKTNIIVFLVDDLGWKDVGCYGSSFYQTPNIDKLAKQGVLFRQGYASCAVCSPTRASIMTGKYPARIMLTEWLPSGRWKTNAKLRTGRFLRALPLEEITLAEALRDGGYKTAIVGKWHLGGEPFSTPAHHGFDVSIAANDHGNPGDYFFPYKGAWSIPTTKLRATWQVLPGGKKGEYLTDRLTDEAIGFIKENQKRPFFLYFSHYAVHTPFQAKQELTEKYEAIDKKDRQGKPVYASMIESVDESFGRVMKTLDDLELSDDTLVIFTSDNGGFAGATNHAPLRGNKGAYYEGGIRVPFIVRWPGIAKADHVSEVPIICNDIYPTCLVAAGIKPHPAQHRDGLDLSPVLKGADKLERSSLFWHYPHYNSHPSSKPSSVIRKGDWKLIETFDPIAKELYNLKTDLSEKNNLIDTETAKANELIQDLRAWRKSVDAEMMEPNPDYQPKK